MLDNYLFGVAGIIIGLALGFTFGHFQGVGEGKQVVHNQILEKAVDVDDKKAIIRNNKPNTAGVINRMRLGTF